MSHKPKVSVPHMGNLSVALASGFRELGVDYVVPPPTTRRTLSLGVRHSPETVCLPFKITLGNFIEALEAGADTLVMPAGRGLCRFGYYARLQEQILRSLGYEFKMVPFDIFKGRIFSLIQVFKELSGASYPRAVSVVRFGIKRLAVMDELERLSQKVRAIELKKGMTTRIFKEAISAISQVEEQASLKRVKEEHEEKLRSVPADKEAKPLKVNVIGEFYVLLEPFVNMDVEVELGKLGVEVERSVFISNWTKFSLIFQLFGVSDKERLHRAAMPYLKRDVGGDGWESVGHKVLDDGNCDGLIHLAPFGCMPEIVAQNIFSSIGSDIPLLTIICDEQMGKAGMITRLEAFVDLLRRQRIRKEKALVR